MQAKEHKKSFGDMIKDFNWSNKEKQFSVEKITMGEIDKDFQNLKETANKEYYTAPRMEEEQLHLDIVNTQVKA